METNLAPNRSLVLVFSLLLLVCQVFATDINNPTHVWDLTDIYKVDQKVYFRDQVTNDRKYSLLQHDLSQEYAVENPKFSPLGLWYLSEGRKDSIKFNQAYNLHFDQRFCFDFWVYFSKLSDSKWQTFYAIQPVDNHNYYLLIRYRSDTEVLRVESQFPYFMREAPAIIEQGWHYISIQYKIVNIQGYDTTSQVDFLIRGPNPAIDIQEVKIPLPYDIEFADLELAQVTFGSFKWVSGSTKLHMDSIEGYIKRIRFFDNYIHNIIEFESQFKQYPQCNGDPPCTLCLMPSKMCEGVNDPYAKIFDFDFDQDTSQYAVDNRYAVKTLSRMSPHEVEVIEAITIFGQGMWFQYDSGLDEGKINLQRWPHIPKAFTLDFWIRTNERANGNEQIRPFGGWDSDSNKNVFVTELKGDKFEMQYLDQYNNVQSFQRSITYDRFYPPDSIWHYFVITMHSQRYSSLAQIKIFPSPTSGGNYHEEFFWFSTIKEVHWNSANIRMYMGHKGHFILKSLRLFNFPISMFDMQVAANVGSDDCTPIGNQPQCDVCPSSGQCLSMCDKRQYGVECKTCHPFCEHCTGPNLEDCVYCTWDESLHVITSGPFGNCTCEEGYYYDDITQACEQCDTTCKACFGSDRRKCYDCSATGNYVNPNMCLGTCSPNGYLGIIQPGIGYFEQTETDGNDYCIPCHPFCTECFGPSENECNACDNEYILSGNTCSDSCEPMKFLNQTSKLCEDCDTSTCINCFGPGINQCLSCQDPTYFQQDGWCVPSCSTGYYPDAYSNCVPCHGYCMQCSDSGHIDVCTSCNDGYFLDNLSFSCYETCRDGTYPDTGTNICAKCHYTCKTCDGSNADNCIECQNNFFEENGICKSSCSPGKFIVGKSCKSCDDKCTTCFGTEPTECYGCKKGYYWFDFECMEECPEGYYGDPSENMCYKCKDECSLCTSYDKCTECIYGPYQLNQGECTYFTCLPSQFRAIRPVLACYDCDQSCKTCQGSTNVDCLSCDDDKLLKDMQCLSCDDQPGMKKPIQDGQLTCDEVCGDGFNYGINKCDDGNNADGDGCSRYCLIEDGYACSGGNSTAPDVCTRTKRPQATLELISSENTLYISFDEEVSLNRDIYEALEINIKGPEDEYIFEWQLQNELNTDIPTKRSVIFLTFYSSLQGDGVETVEVTFLDKNVYLGPTGNQLATTQVNGELSKFEYINPEDMKKIGQAGAASMKASIGAMALNMGISLVFGGSISSMWVMLNTIQLLSLLPLMAVPWPLYSVKFFEMMLSSHGDSGFIPNIFEKYILNMDEVTLEELNSRFETYGYTNSNFLLLSGEKITMFAILGVFYPVVHYMNQKFADKHKCCKGWKFLKEKYVYTIPLRFALISFASIYLSCFLNLWMMSFANKSDIISIFAAMTVLVVLTYSPVFLMNTLQQNYKHITKKKFQQKWSTIMSELDQTRPTRYAYYPVFLIRRAAFVIMLVFFSNSPRIQVGILSSLCVMMFAYIVIIKPQREKLMLFLNALAEVLLFILHVFSLVFISKDMNEDVSNKYGFVVCVFVAIYILVNWGIIFTLIVIGMVRKIKLWCQNRNKVKEVKDKDKAAKRAKKKALRDYQQKKQEDIKEKRKEQVKAFQQFMEEGCVPGQGDGFIININSNKNEPINVLALQKNQYQPKDGEVISNESQEDIDNSSRPIFNQSPKTSALGRRRAKPDGPIINNSNDRSMSYYDPNEVDPDDLEEVFVSEEMPLPQSDYAPQPSPFQKSELNQIDSAGDLEDLEESKADMLHQQNHDL